jgi:NAD(P)-dependent dehydrogenase (short-subunit alcohol dehydrogenase family)
MTPERKVVVITGASRGIGAQLSKAYRHIGYQVIASSRSMRESDDPAILVIEGDITCAYRKSSPSILVMQSTQDRTAQNASRCLGGTRYRRVLVQR